jgi:ABC-type multidrug transport system ATPase subunit
MKKVNDIITELRLQKCAHTRIGGSLVKGVSGGERKRTSIGVELITDPSLIFLDEPTTGLDSFTAQSVIETLRDLTLAGRTVISTIH